MNSGNEKSIPVEENMGEVSERVGLVPSDQIHTFAIGPYEWPRTEAVVEAQEVLQASSAIQAPAVGGVQVVLAS